MIKRITTLLFSLLLSLGVLSSAHAAIVLFDYGINIDGSVSKLGNPVPSAVDISGFNDTSDGLGNIGITVIGAGAHNVIAFFDHEIDETANTFYNEYGSASGTPAAGQSWEIDEPGFEFGDIYDNFLDGALDNSNNVPAGRDDDVSMAIGWEFLLAADEMALITFALSESAPGGFYLKHRDPDSDESIYLSSSLSISPIPVPAAIWLFATGMIGLVGFSRRNRKSTN